MSAASPPGDDIVTLKEFDTHHEAELARSFLEAHGVSAFVPDQHSNISTRHAVIRSVRLQVRESELALARKLLAEAEAGTHSAEE